MTSWRASRLDQLPPYLFIEIDRAKDAAIQAGRDVIDFGVGDPDRPTPRFIVDRMAEAIRNPENHRYPLGRGYPRFRKAVVEFFKRRYSVALDAATEVLCLIGSKEGIGHLPIGVVNPGDVVLVPDPGYPVYTSWTIFAGATPYVMPLKASNGFLPDLEAIPAEVLKKARLMWINYPNNPTAAVAPPAFYEKVVAFAKRHEILVASDVAYNETYYGNPPPSIFQIPGAIERAIEFHSLSKTFNMTGWRVGFAVGNASAVKALADVKGNVDSGLFGAVQDAAIAALAHSDHVEVRAILDVYRERRNVLVEGLRSIGLKPNMPEATFYVWCQCPPGHDSMSVAKRILAEANVVVVPGIGFGKHGEGYFRFALTVEVDRVREAVGRLAKLGW